MTLAVHGALGGRGEGITFRVDGVVVVSHARDGAGLNHVRDGNHRELTPTPEVASLIYHAVPQNFRIRKAAVVEAIVLDRALEELVFTRIVTANGKAIGKRVGGA